jgi:hypothetical protein
MVGGVDFHSQRATALSTRPTVVVATVGRLLGHCGLTPASTRARQQQREVKSTKPQPAHHPYIGYSPPLCRAGWDRNRREQTPPQRTPSARTPKHPR